MGETLGDVVDERMGSVISQAFKSSCIIYNWYIIWGHFSLLLSRALKRACILILILVVAK